jgi:hypothetical protein
MVEKILVLLFAFVILISISATVLAAECGDGKCDGEEDCVNCVADCGNCNGAICIVDDSCASNICCNGVCRDSCILYSTTQEEGLTGLFLSSPISIIIFEIALILAVIVIIFILWRKKRKSQSAQSVR